MSKPKFDLAIYMPLAAEHYRRSGPEGGGAELQTVLLARTLAARGLRIAHIVWPIEDPLPPEPGMPTVVQRPPFRGGRRAVGGAREALSIWQSLRVADASSYLFRTGRSRLIAGALFCQVHRRKLIYAGAHDLDFTFDGAPGTHGPPSRAALRRTDAIVTQTQQQLALAQAALGKDHLVTTIPSFVEPVPPAEHKPEAFIWIGRLAPYKQPLEYVRLAEALPDRQFRMVFMEAQDPAPSVVAELRAAAERLPNLELLGRVARRRVLEVIERSFAVVSTSTHEGMPNVFLEAWARAVPVLSLQCDPGGQIARQNAGLVAGGSRAELVRNAGSLSQDPALRGQLGANGRRYVNAAHDPTLVADQWMLMLDRLQGTSGSGP
ncbi:MAG TPA: glycosyltransferase family 4 protein [Solirubrobacterales bacterium]|jgi:glycosyltransferase involved in cell wall biosynthesis|nr:glycosyltransferase family 4 protein [Solirubrobacterales bacterium]